MMKFRGTRVKTFTKLIQNNKSRYYLDFYPGIEDPETGHITRRYFLTNRFKYNDIQTEVILKLKADGTFYKVIKPVIDPKTGKPKRRRLSSKEQQHNKDTEKDVEKIRAQRENEINKPEIYSTLELERLQFNEASKENFLDYFHDIANTKNGSDKDNWLTVHKHLNAFSSGKLEFRDLSENLCNEFRRYLLNLKSFDSENTISQNTACTYFVKFKASLKLAYKEKKIPQNLISNLQNIKLIDTYRSYLTTDELNKLIKTPCAYKILKSAALFSALTGLRKGDVLKLVWGEIEIIDGRPVINFRQQKTKSFEHLWISEQALQLLGTPGKPDQKVFPGLKINSYYSRYLFRWLGEAGITKKISFHNFRHTFATLQHSKGTDLFTLSKMLGHKNIKTTQIYAKVVDKSIQDAADRIKLDF